MTPEAKCQIVELMRELLQTAFEADPAAMHALVCNRVPCNVQLAEHPHVIVDASPVLAATQTVGAIGLLNGLLLAIDADELISLNFGSQNADPERKQFLGFGLTARQR